MNQVDQFIRLLDSAGLAIAWKTSLYRQLYVGGGWTEHLRREANPAGLYADKSLQQMYS